MFSLTKIWSPLEPKASVLPMSYVKCIFYIVCVPSYDIYFTNHICLCGDPSPIVLETV